jgi:hypothetical protein
LATPWLHGVLSAVADAAVGVVAGGLVLLAVTGAQRARAFSK